MAQTEIAEILNTMRAETERNNENFEKVLSTINSKLELMSEDNETVDLMRLYISELKKVIEDKFNSELIKLEELFAITDSIPDKISFESLEEKIAKYQLALDNLKDILSDSIAENSQVFSGRFSNLENKLSSIITSSDFTDFRKDLGEFIQKIIDNTAILNTELTFNSEKLENILFLIKNLNFKSDFENVVSNILEIKDTIENNDNYRNISSEIAGLKNNLSENFLDYSETLQEKHFELKNKLVDIDNSLKTLSEISYSEELDRLSGLIALTADDISILKEEFRQSAEADFENSSRLSDKINEISLQLSENSTNIKENIDNSLQNNQQATNELSNKIDNCEEILESIKEIIENSDCKEEIIQEFQNFKDELPAIVTVDDFELFRTDLTDFIGKIIDNANVLHLNSDDIKEQVSLILEKFESLNYKSDFKNIADCVNEIKTSFENNSKTNYDNIVNEINDLKFIIGQNLDCQNIETRENFEIINNVLTNAIDDINNIRDLSANKHIEILDSISEELHSVINNSTDKLNSNIDLNVSGLKPVIEQINAELENLKSDFTKINDTNIYTISSGFSNVKISLENLLSAFTSINETVENTSAKNSERILTNILELVSNLDELKAEIHQFSSSYLEKVFSSIGEISVKIDEAVDFSEIYEKLEDLKTSITSIDFGAQINEQIEGLRSLIIENTSDENIVSKLFELESAIINNSDNADKNLELLQNKLTEFVHIVENSNSDTEGKIAASFEEIAAIKEELLNLSDSLKNAQASNDKKLNEALSLVDAGVENIIFNLNNLNESVGKDFKVSLDENTTSINEKLDNLYTTVSEFKNDFSLNNVDIFNNIEEKISTFKEELNLVNTDIVAAIECKNEEIVRAFEPIKTGIDAFVGLDFEKILTDLRSQIELSFMNFSVDINSEFTTHSENISRLEQAWKEIFNKTTALEDFITEKIHNNIELLNIALENNSRSIKAEIENNVDELKQYIAEQTNGSQLEDIVNVLKDSLLNKMTEISDAQQETSANHELISSKIETLSDNLKNYLTSISQEISESCSNTGILPAIELLHQDCDELKNSIENIASKVDVIALDTSVEDLQERFDQIDETNDQISNMISTLNIKVDALAADNSLNEFQDNFDKIGETSDQISDMISTLNIKVDTLAADNSLEELQERFDRIDETSDKVSDMISTLNIKVDTLAADNSQFDILEEIDDIKNIIFEQRKFFEESSDEKTAAIDKYLRDVLLKLDNVDLDKNSEDIKETILNALVSLVDQISFVEETEDIKEFVEEKTGEINENIKEIQKQLKQLSNPDDDFEYVYTLQDVETDIAKLRLAINNMTGNDLSDVTDEMKKLASVVENIESSLTQEQTIDLKTDIEKLNEDIISISSRTNKLLLNSDEAYKTLNEGLSNFNSIIFKLEDRINYLDTAAATERLERKIDDIQSLSAASANSDKVFNQVMMYLGEWIDTAGENINHINEKTAQIDEIKETIQELKTTIPEKTLLLDKLEEKFEQQERRIENLEIKIEKILSTLEEKDDMLLNRKVDKIEKMLSQFGANIEKLTSYVE